MISLRDLPADLDLEAIIMGLDAEILSVRYQLHETLAAQAAATAAGNDSPRVGPLDVLGSVDLLAQLCAHERGLGARGAFALQAVCGAVAQPSSAHSRSANGADSSDCAPWCATAAVLHLASCTSCSRHAGQRGSALSECSNSSPCCVCL